MVSPQKIRELANNGETFADQFDGKRILTVGRISKEKGCEEALETLSLLLKKGCRVKWYFVGEGDDYQHCRAVVLQRHLQDSVCFLGVKTNPYGYMRDCDIYVQPSRHEGYCLSLAEALCFENPIVATGFSGARAQLSKRRNGIISGMTPSDICDSIVKAMSFDKVEGNRLYVNDIEKFLRLL